MEKAHRNPIRSKENGEFEDQIITSITNIPKENTEDGNLVQDDQGQNAPELTCDLCEMVFREISLLEDHLVHIHTDDIETSAPNDAQSGVGVENESKEEEGEDEDMTIVGPSLNLPTDENNDQLDQAQTNEKDGNLIEKEPSIDIENTINDGLETAIIIKEIPEVVAHDEDKEEDTEEHDPQVAAQDTEEHDIISDDLESPSATEYPPNPIPSVETIEEHDPQVAAQDLIKINDQAPNALVQDNIGDISNIIAVQQKIKTYKKQIKEAEEIVALNLAECRKAQQELEEAEKRTKMAGIKENVSNESIPIKIVPIDSITEPLIIDISSDDEENPEPLDLSIRSSNNQPLDLTTKQK